jgi:hypothetical protein
MYIDPAKVRAAMRAWMAQIPHWLQEAEFPFVRWHFVPRVLAHGHKEILFYDTTAGLWQAGIGQAFSEEQDARFEHLHCATYVDLIGEALPGLAAGHAAVYANLENARGWRERQAEWYRQNAVVTTKETKQTKRK